MSRLWTALFLLCVCWYKSSNAVSVVKPHTQLQLNLAQFKLSLAQKYFTDQHQSQLLLTKFQPKVSRTNIQEVITVTVTFVQETHTKSI